MCVNMKKEAMAKEAILKSFRCSNASGAKTKGDRLLRKRCLDFFMKDIHVNLLHIQLQIGRQIPCMIKAL